MINHYRTLGVDPDAEPVVIRSAYLALMRRYHPDSNSDEAGQARAQEIAAAYEVLRDPQRRAAYDGERRLSFRDNSAGGGGGGPAAALVPQGRARGGTAARNLFLMLAAGTAALGYWALQQPLGQPGGWSGGQAPVTVAEAPPPPSPGVAVEPELPVVAVIEPNLPAPVTPAIEEDVDIPVVLPDLPEVRQAPLPARIAQQRAPERPRLAERARAVPAPAVRAAPPARVQAPTPSAPAPVARPVMSAKAGPALDIPGLERHLRLLTDQSVRYGDAAERSRVFATREPFLDRLQKCRSDLCRRDTYLRRNQEVAEIMRD